MFENHRKSLIQHCELRYVYILSGLKFIKNPKNGPFWRVFENLKLAVNQCYQTGQFLKDKNWWKCQNWWKVPKLKTWNESFWLIFKQFSKHFGWFSSNFLGVKMRLFEEFSITVTCISTTTRENLENFALKLCLHIKRGRKQRLARKIAAGGAN